VNDARKRLLALLDDPKELAGQLQRYRKVHGNKTVRGASFGLAYDAIRWTKTFDRDCMERVLLSLTSENVDLMDIHQQLEDGGFNTIPYPGEVPCSI